MRTYRWHLNFKSTVLFFLILNIIAAKGAFSKEPDYHWVTQGSGLGSEIGYSVVTDKADNSYVAGTYRQTLTLGDTTLTASSEADLFLAKPDFQGKVLWVRSAIGDDDEYVADVTLDSDGNVILYGSFRGDVDFGNGPTWWDAMTDLFIAKYNTNGNFLWIEQGKNVDEIFSSDIAVDQKDNITVTGRFEGTAYFSSTSIQSAGQYEIFCAQYNSNGSVLWIKQTGGPKNDYSLSITCNTVGQALITGFFEDTVLFDQKSLVAVEYNDLFIAKLNATNFATAITIKSPNNGEVWYTGKNNRIEWQADVYTGEIMVQISKDNGAPWGLFIREHQVGWGFVGKAWSNADAFQKLVPGSESVLVTPYIKVKDAWGEIGDKAVVEIMIDDNPRPIDAFGFKFSYDPRKLTFKSVCAGRM